MLDKKLIRSINQQSRPSESLLRKTKKAVSELENEEKFSSSVIRCTALCCLLAVVVAVSVLAIKSAKLEWSPKNAPDSSAAEANIGWVPGNTIDLSESSGINPEQFHPADENSVSDIITSAFTDPPKPEENNKLEFVKVFNENTEQNHLMALTALNDCYAVSVYGCNSTFAVRCDGNRIYSVCLPTEFDFDWEAVSSKGSAYLNTPRQGFLIQTLSAKPEDFKIKVMTGDASTGTMKYAIDVSFVKNGTEYSVPLGETLYIGDGFDPDCQEKPKSDAETDFTFFFDENGFPVFQTISGNPAQITERDGEVTLSLKDSDGNRQEIPLSDNGETLKYGGHRLMIFDGGYDPGRPDSDDFIILLPVATGNSVCSGYSVYFIDTENCNIRSYFPINLSGDRFNSFTDELSGNILAFRAGDYLKLTCEDETAIYMLSAGGKYRVIKALPQSVLYSSSSDVTFGFDTEQISFYENDGEITASLLLYADGVPVGYVSYGLEDLSDGYPDVSKAEIEFLRNN